MVSLFIFSSQVAMIFSWEVWARKKKFGDLFCWYAIVLCLSLFHRESNNLSYALILLPQKPTFYLTKECLRHPRWLGLINYFSALKDASENKRSALSKKSFVLSEEKHCYSCCFVKFQSFNDWYILTRWRHFTGIKMRGLILHLRYICLLYIWRLTPKWPQTHLLFLLSAYAGLQ